VNVCVGGGGPAGVQRAREADVRTLHRLQLRAQQLLVSQESGPVARRVLPAALRILLHSPLMPRIQRRVFFGAPLPLLDPAFSFRTSDGPKVAAVGSPPCEHVGTVPLQRGQSPSNMPWGQSPPDRQPPGSSSS
jgi:hypothetical protein